VDSQHGILWSFKSAELTAALFNGQPKIEPWRDAQRWRKFANLDGRDLRCASRSSSGSSPRNAREANCPRVFWNL